MSFFNCNCCCNCRPGCSGLAVIAATIVGVLAAFLQISGVIALSTLLIGGFLGIAVVYLAVVTVAAALSGNSNCCQSLRTALSGALGTIALAVVLLVVDVAAGSVIGALLVGALLFFVTLLLVATACYARCLCERAE